MGWREGGWQFPPSFSIRSATNGVVGGGRGTTTIETRRGEAERKRITVASSLSSAARHIGRKRRKRRTRRSKVARGSGAARDAAVISAAVHCKRRRRGEGEATRSLLALSALLGVAPHRCKNTNAIQRRVAASKRRSGGGKGGGAGDYRVVERTLAASVLRARLAWHTRPRSRPLFIPVRSTALCFHHHLHRLLFSFFLFFFFFFCRRCRRCCCGFERAVQNR